MIIELALALSFELGIIIGAAICWIAINIK